MRTADISVPPGTLPSGALRLYSSVFSPHRRSQLIQPALAFSVSSSQDAMRTFYRMCAFLQHFSALQHSPNDWFFSCQQQIQCIWHRRKRKPIFSPGEFHRQRSLAGYSPRGRRVTHDWAAKTGRHRWRAFCCCCSSFLFCFCVFVLLFFCFCSYGFFLFVLLFAFVFLFLEEKERRGLLFQKLETPRDQMHSFF